MHGLLVLMVTILSFSVPAWAGYDLDLLKAIQSDDATVESVEALLNNPPVGQVQPLKDTKWGPGVIFILHRFMVDNMNRSERVAKMVKRAIELGADPMKVVDFGGPSPYHFDLTSLEIILHEWEFQSKKPEDPGPRFAAAAQKMFDIFIETKSIDLGFQPLFAFSETETRRFGIVHWLILRQAKPEIRDYFLRHGVGPESMDDGQWNMAMTAAASADLATLKSIREICGLPTAAQMFNYRCPIRFNPTVLHAAVAGTIHFNADQVIPVIEYLVQNGADPSQRSMYHDLLREVDFWLPRHPKRQSEFLKVREFLVQNMPRLTALHKACRELLKVTNPSEPRQ